MTLDEYNAFCASLPATTHVVQWGGAHVWKVGGKVFAIAGWSDGEELAVTFKVSEMAYRHPEGAARLPPCALSRLARHEMDSAGRPRESMDDEALKDYLRESRRLVIAGADEEERGRSWDCST